MPSSIPEVQTAALFLRVLPDPETCRTRPIAKIEQFGMCLVRCPVTCPYVSVSETGYICKFCTHPNWKDFVQP